MRLAPRPEMEACPCSDPAHCKAVTKQHEREVFGFGANGNWTQFDWDTITTIAWAADPQLVCTAHAHDARVIAAAPSDMPLSADPAVRKAWVDKTVGMIRDQHLDGIT